MASMHNAATMLVGTYAANLSFRACMTIRDIASTGFLVLHFVNQVAVPQQNWHGRHMPNAHLAPPCIELRLSGKAFWCALADAGQWRIALCTAVAAGAGPAGEAQALAHDCHWGALAAARPVVC